MRKVDTAEERWRRELPEQGFLLSLVKALVISVGLFEWDMHPTSNEKLCQSFSSSTGIGLQITRRRLIKTCNNNFFFPIRRFSNVVHITMRFILIRFTQKNRIYWGKYCQ